MGCPLRLLVLALAVCAIVAQRRGRASRGGAGGNRHIPRPATAYGPSPPDLEQLFTRLREEDCLPEDYTQLDFSQCRNMTDHNEKLSCVVTSVGLSSDSGYDQAAFEALGEELSGDKQWKSRQKELLEVCSLMMLEELPDEKQNIFMLACSLQLSVSDCARQRLVAAAAAADSENGARVAGLVAGIAEGHCFSRGIRYSPDAREQWGDCARRYGLDLDVLKEAFRSYLALKKGGNSVAGISADSIGVIDAELEKLEIAAECYAVSSGEMNSDGEINYDQIRVNIENSDGSSHLRNAAQAIVAYCEDEDPDYYADFYECSIKARANVCAGLKSYAIVNRGDKQDKIRS